LISIVAIVDVIVFPAVLVTEAMICYEGEFSVQKVTVDYVRRIGEYIVFGMLIIT
jgi:hypothetical protein